MDKSKPVKIYRNLNSKEVSYSVQQDGLVVGHTKELGINLPRFKVSQAGRRRVLQEKHKNVHAFIVGHIRPVTHIDKSFKLVYNPYKAGTFLVEEYNHYKGGWFFTGKTHPVDKADRLKITEEGIWAAFAEGESPS